MSASRSAGDTPPRLLWVAAFVAVAAACAPLLRDGFVGGHEGPAYLFRAAEFAGQLAEGEARPRWCPDFYWGYGYPFFVYYPPGLFYLSAAVGAVGASTATALEAVTILGWALFFFGVRRLARCWTGDPAAIVAGIVAVLATYRLSQVHVRGDLAEALGTALLPWILAEFVLLCRVDPPPGGWARAAARGGLLLGLVFYVHTLSAVAVCMSIGLIGLSGAVRAGPGATLRAAGAGAIGVLAGAAYWLPVQLGRPAVRTEQMLDRVPGAFSWWYGDHFVAWWQRLDPRIGFGDSLPGVGDTMSFGSSPVVWVAVLAVVVIAGRDAEFRRRATGPLLALGAANVMLLGIAEVVWDVAPLLPWFQFPWRLLLLEGLAPALLSAHVVHRRGRPTPAAASIATVATIVAAVPSLWACWTHAGEATVRLMPDQAAALEAPRTLSTVGMHHPMGIDYTITTAARNEYLPKRVSRPPTAHPDAPGRVRPRLDLGPPADELGAWRRWIVDVPADDVYEVAWFAFPGIEASRNGEPLPLVDDGDPRGLVRFALPAGPQVVDVWYAGPPHQRAANLLAVLGLGFALVGLRRRSGEAREEG